MTVHGYLKKIYTEHQKFWTSSRAWAFLGSCIFFGFAMIIQSVADTYVAHTNGPYVADIFLSHLPTLDIDFFIVQGALILTFVIVFLALTKPKYISFLIKSVALFVIIRAFFISLTHLGVDPHELQLDTNSIGFGLYNVLFNTKSDFFFSGHTGMPFLMGLIFWKETYWRYFFFACSLIFGCSVLLAHIHYSIDVFAAPFMTYSIYTIARHMFPKDFKMLLHGIPTDAQGR